MPELLHRVAGLPVLVCFALTRGAHPATYGATTDMLARRTQWRPRLVKRVQHSPSPHPTHPTYFTIGLSSSVVGPTTLPVIFLVARFFLLAVLWTRTPAVAGRVEALYRRALNSDFRWVTAVFLFVVGVTVLWLAGLE